MPFLLPVEDVSNMKMIPDTISDKDLAKAVFSKFLPRKKKLDGEIVKSFIMPYFLSSPFLI